MNDIAVVGFCPICGQGRQFIARELSSGELFVMCEDCESEWDDPQRADDLSAALSSDHGRSDFVTVKEMQEHSWFALIQNR